MENEIVESFSKSIYEPIKDTMIDYAEIGMDLLTEQFIGEVAKEIPFMKSVYSLGNVMLSIKIEEN